MRPVSVVELAIGLAVGGSVLAVAVPAFFKNLSASKLSEPINGLDTLVRHAVAYGNAPGRPDEFAFPPPAPLTPSVVPRGVRVLDPPEAWEHLTWRSLDFRIDQPHAFSFKFDSVYDPSTGVMRFAAIAHGDLDGDGVLSTFEAQGERSPGHAARVLPGMYIDREVE
ncbi:MAG TPA: hypothetical protein VGM56_21825 [Byssovorax sp.]|jgi:hypothetical protein